MPPAVLRYRVVICRWHTGAQVIIFGVSYFCCSFIIFFLAALRALDNLWMDVSDETHIHSIYYYFLSFSLFEKCLCVSETVYLVISLYTQMGIGCYLLYILTLKAPQRCKGRCKHVSIVGIATVFIF